MRIWSKVLVPYLPKKQLMAMRYELGDMIKQYPNIKHGLVKFANDYNVVYLAEYFRVVLEECKKRNINMKQDYNNFIWGLWQIKVPLEGTYLPYGLKFEEDNEEYLKICLMNLYEKFIRNMIPQEEWQKIEDKFGGVM